ncbi:MAG: hypothetical protein RMY64_25365 [Nostoc sp. DedQUE08]|uniref:hypothetical protein n=1 Tax=unclassified Nostoc TaxID=2593658 RepID=UPI002AD47C83|nr:MULTISPECIES: hypothetical protein [unclassified Nostoc]MDZ8068923.1 hypothetical protein [Nostoc sp. DedQUE08]MDZ8095689.1 hypothetical protein [Nostoc sp. DedQUE05]
MQFITKKQLFTEITAEEAAKVNGGGFFTNFVNFLNKILKENYKLNPNIFQKSKYE